MNLGKPSIISNLGRHNYKSYQQQFSGIRYQNCHQYTELLFFFFHDFE